MADKHRGACFCGAVEIEATGAPLEMGYCHCDSCRRYSGAPLSAYLLWRGEDVRVTKGADLLGGFNKIGMSEHLSANRANGLQAVIKQIKRYAVAFQARTETE